MNRKPGAPEETVHSKPQEVDLNSTMDSKKSKDDRAPSSMVVKAILPKYEIVSTSKGGQKPSNIQGRIKFKKVVFSYPTRPDERVLEGLTTTIQPGQTVAFVGPRYGLCRLTSECICGATHRFGVLSYNGLAVPNFGRTGRTAEVGKAQWLPCWSASTIRNLEALNWTAST